MKTIIEAHAIVKHYESRGVITSVLRGVDLSIREGEFVAIMGRSGAGKSTLLYQLSLLDRPTSGSIVIDGVRTQTLTERSLTNFRLNHLGYVFQDYALIPDLTALENVALPLMMQGKGKARASHAAAAALERVMLGERINFLPNQLSGGEQQRVSIARAIAHAPKIIFADEPTANLDSEMAETILTIFEMLHHDGQTIVMVTHENEYAQRADRIIMVRDGILVPS